MKLHIILITIITCFVLGLAALALQAYGLYVIGSTIGESELSGKAKAKFERWLDE